MSFCFSNASPIVRGGLSSLESNKSGCIENLICIHHYFQLHMVDKCCGCSDTICAIHLVSYPLYLPAASHDRFHPPILPYSLSITVESVHWLPHSQWRRASETRWNKAPSHVNFRYFQFENSSFTFFLLITHVTDRIKLKLIV